jgi:hypothetical protein
LEVDPTTDAPDQYVSDIATLLRSFWAAGMDAVAACDFEALLPPNTRRETWSQAGDVAVRAVDPMRPDAAGFPATAG